MKIKVSWEGDFYGATTYTNLLHRYVLIPEWQRVKDPQDHVQIMVCSVLLTVNHCDVLLYQGGHEEWLIVDKHMVDLYDRECNRIGSSFRAFRFQSFRCNRNKGA